LAAKRDLRLPQLLAKLDRYECVFLDDLATFSMTATKWGCSLPSWFREM
jgi:hypothetical protein